MDISRRDFITTTVAGSIALGAAVPQARTRRRKPPRTCRVSGQASHHHFRGQWLRIPGCRVWLPERRRRHARRQPSGWSRVRRTIPRTTAWDSADCPTRKAWSSWMPAACTGPSRRAGSVGGVRNIRNDRDGCKSGHRTHRPRDAGRRRRRAVRRRDGLSAREPPDRALPQDLAAVEGVSLERRLVGPGHCPSGLARHRRTSRRAIPGSKAFSASRSVPPSLGIEPEFRTAAVRKVLFPPTGTIHCSALNEKGEMSGVTTTSGLAYKLPGRLGDSPVIGAGCYTDQDVGSAGATGSGEKTSRWWARTRS